MQTTGARNRGAALWPEDEAPREVRLPRPSTAHQSVRTVVRMRMNASPGFIQANDPPLPGADPLVGRKRAQVATTAETVPIALAGCQSVGHTGRPAWRAEVAAGTLIGRDAELHMLGELIDGAWEAGAALVLLGEPGVGKSELVSAVADMGRSAGFQVLETAGVESETRMPFAGLHQMLRPLRESIESLPARQRDALLVAFGEAEGPTPEPFPVALATLNLLADAATQRPVLLAIDDVQWLDRASHDVVTFVARRAGPDAIVVVGAVRRPHTGPFVTAGLPELDVAPIEDASARALIARGAADVPATERERMLREARGNPLALVELPIAWRASARGALDEHLPLTERLGQAFAGRIAQLPPATRDALLVVAVDTNGGTPEILAAASSLAGHQLDVHVLEPAAGATLLRFDEIRVQLRHPLVRSAILQAEAAVRRQRAHAAMAAVVVDDPYRRTWHRAHSIVGPEDVIADQLEASHLLSLRRGSVLPAIWALERSAQLTTDPSRRGRRLLIAAEHAFSLGRADMVDRLLEAASSGTLSETERARMEWLREIFDDGVPGDATSVRELCDNAERSDRAGAPDLALRLTHGAAMRCWWADAGPAARARAAQVAEEIGGSPDDPRRLAALAASEPVMKGTAVVDTLAGIVTEAVTDADALWLLGMAAHAVGDPITAVDLLARSEARLREQGRLGILAQVLGMSAFDHLELGDWHRAGAAADEARRLARDTDQPLWGVGALGLTAALAGLRGDNERAQALASEAERLAGGKRLNSLLAVVQLARGYGWLSTGNPSEALDALVRLFDPADPCFHLTERFHAIMYLAEAAVLSGRAGEVREIMAGLERLALVTSAPTLHTHLLYARAVLAEDSDAEQLYKAALGGDLVRWPSVRARLELAHGSWLRRRRRVAESRAPLRNAQTTLEVIGAGPWAEQARTELRAAGGRTTRGRRVALDVLSPQEREIARLAAEGLSNRDIGQRLYLSHRTIGSHLYRIFPKLDITSRAQLAGRLQAV
jgi:DNA-binding CsgD family transcriptional regulator